MTTSKRGGKRPGAGRPKGSGRAARASVPPTAPGSAPALYPDAESYLAAVVEGREPPDALRIAAAKAVLPYQKRRQRVPLAAARTPKAQQRADDMQVDGDINAKYRARLTELRATRKKGD